MTPRRSPKAPLVAAMALALTTAFGAGLVADTQPAEGASAAGPAEPNSYIRPEEAQVDRLYRAVLGRAPEPGGFGFWFARLTTVETLDEVAAHFVASDEFAELAGAPTDEEFLTLLYGHVLGRAPDAGGRQFWLLQMALGMPRVRVVVLFAESPEFITVTNTALAELPPFNATSNAVTAADLGSSWRPGCPVGPEDLRQLSLTHVDLDGDAAVGQLIVHRDDVDSIVRVFAQLYAARYPIERMVAVSEFGSDDNASMAANNTSAFNCRPVTGGSGWSRHAYGRAIDINPLVNPYAIGSTVLPPEGEAWTNRDAHHPGLIRRGDVVTAAFAAEGWRWGGDFVNSKDWQHFDRR